MTVPIEKADLLLTGARIFTPGSGFSDTESIAVAGGKIVAVGPADNLSATKTVDLDGRIICPGIVDIHTHIYHKANSACVDPLPTAIESGATTLVDAGTAGASSIHGFVDFISRPCPVRVLAFLNISYAGIFGFNPKIKVGEAEDARLLHADLCCEAVDRFRAHVVGIKVRIGKGESGENGDLALDRALEVSDRLGLPLMAHIGLPPLSLDSVLARMRKGDILTHCFRGSPNTPLGDNADGIRASVTAARSRGVLFDIGHGMGSFSVETSREMIAEGFLPDTISSDVHQFNVGGPVHNLLHVASKFVALGMSLEQVLDRLTKNPAQAIGRPDLGTMDIGSVADLSILDVNERDTKFVDCSGQAFTGEMELSSHAVVVGGEILANE